MNDRDEKLVAVQHFRMSYTPGEGIKSRLAEGRSLFHKLGECVGCGVCLIERLHLEHWEATGLLCSKCVARRSQLLSRP